MVPVKASALVGAVLLVQHAAASCDGNNDQYACAGQTECAHDPTLFSHGTPLAIYAVCSVTTDDSESTRDPAVVARVQLVLRPVPLLARPSWPQPVVLTLSGYGAMAPWNARQDALLKKLCEQRAKENGLERGAG